MSIVRRNPGREFDDLFNLFSDLSRSNWGESMASSDWAPPVDIRETDDAYRIEVELPSVVPADVKVTVKDGVLVVTGERRYEKETEGKVHRVERRYGRFSRSFRLPENADEANIQAASKDGVLTLTVHKRAEVKPRAIEIRVS
jgi:HSP20 family protein